MAKITHLLFITVHPKNIGVHPKWWFYIILDGIIE